MSDTPRTDAEARTLQAIDLGLSAVHAEFARELERELADAERKLAEIEKFCDLAQSFSATYQRERILAIVRNEETNKSQTVRGADASE